VTVTANEPSARFSLPANVDMMDIILISNATNEIEFYWYKLVPGGEPNPQRRRQLNGPESRLDAQRSDQQARRRQSPMDQTRVPKPRQHRRQSANKVRIMGPRVLFGMRTATWRIPSSDLAPEYSVQVYGTSEPVEITMMVVHPCDNNACGTHGTCARVSGGAVLFNCTCDAGWSGVRARLILPSRFWSSYPGLAETSISRCRISTYTTASLFICGHVTILHISHICILQI
jgi:hypothetical protein